MKHIFLLLNLICLAQIVEGQDRIYENTYKAKDWTIALSIYSDNKYELVSGWSTGSGNDIISGAFYWSKGYIQNKNDTLIFIDSISSKKIFATKKLEGDAIELISWEDYKNKEDETNYFEGWDTEINKKVFLDDFLIQNNLLYLSTIYEGTIEKKRLKLLKAYSWKNGKKKQIYQDGIGFTKDWQK